VIPTTVAAATRASDNANMSMVLAAGTSQTWYAAGTTTAASAGANRSLITVHDGTVSNRFTIFRVSSTGRCAQFISVGGATTTVSDGPVNTLGTQMRMAQSLQENLQMAAGNGSLLSNATRSIPAVTTLSIGYRGYTASDYFNGTIQSVAGYVGTALPSSTLQALTS
jgi:hypothetical protein